MRVVFQSIKQSDAMGVTDNPNQAAMDHGDKPLGHDSL